ncbi:hypothetical protein [Hyphobacterium sp.]|uniref:hypothetical protein n=1 Tax=Hyphobacterium sp. TaxID=2004662 RepID=UPI003B5250CB
MNRTWLTIAVVSVSVCAPIGADEPRAERASQSPENVLVLRRQGSRMVDQGAAGDIADNELVCRIEAPTGTRIRKTQCRTQGEWEAIAREGRRFMELRQTGTADGN